MRCWPFCSERAIENPFGFVEPELWARRKTGLTAYSYSTPAVAV